MLRLKKLQILGFKSFCDRTDMHFPGSGIVGIVGPNGCGKSNIADAISWVLGEQSAKSLRGGRMEDVIFAGTRERPATGMAEVSLTLTDPDDYNPGLEPVGEVEDLASASDGWDESAAAEEPADGSEAGAEAEEDTEGAGASGHGVVLTIRKRRKFVAHNRKGEIVVTRRLFRSGDSEYLMNGKLCRLRDIQELFLGTGLGPESYAIIEQGRIGQILSSKPYDRRAIIEEAAGISKYKARRRLAEARLEAARLNLSRINDIFEEVTRQMNSLKRQASRAQRYRVLKTELDGLHRRLLRARAADYDAIATRLQAEQADARGLVQAAQREIVRGEAARSQTAAHCEQLELDLRRLADEAARCERECGQARQQIAFHRQQIGELQQRATENSAEAARVDVQRAHLAGELSAAERDLDAAGQVAAEARAACDACHVEFDAAQKFLAGVEQGLEQCRGLALRLVEQSSHAEHQAAQAEADHAAAAAQLDRARREHAAAHSELEAGGVRRGQLQLEFQGQEMERGQLTAHIAELDQETTTLRARETACREAVQQTGQALAAAAARRRSLEEMVSHHGYSSDAVRRLFAERGGAAGFQPLGVLGEFVEVDAPFDRAIEQFLREELNYVVVASWDEANAGLELLRSQQEGRATFLVHGEEAASPTETAPAPIEPGVLPLLSEVRALNGFRHNLGAIVPRLRLAYWATESAQARRLAAQHPELYFLTPTGECLHGATVSGGAGAGSGPLSLKRELRELHQSEAGLKSALAQNEHDLAATEQRHDALTRELENLRARAHELEKRQLTSGEAVRQLEGELQRAQNRLGQAQLEAERGRTTMQSAADRRDAAQAERLRLQVESTALHQRQATAEAEFAAVRGRRDQAGQAVAAAQAEAARVEERSRAAGAACDRLRRQDADLVQRLQHLVHEATEFAARQVALTGECDALANQVEHLTADLAAAQQSQRSQETALAEARATAQREEAALGTQREQLETRRQQLSELEVAAARLESDRDHLRQDCRDELGLELAVLVAEALAPLTDEDGLELPEPALAELDTAVQELRRKIDNLGPVNMMALEEYEETQQRHGFMDTQRQDLLTSIADTQKAIQEMDTISRQKFQEAFERINEYFQETFRVLFGGGQGFLRLSEIEGAAESGVDIVAQPPGKKLQNALLLSGGEKAMTAMALLLAIFRYQPSPFCLLDEVDAPLDEANVGRFSQMVQQMASATQFIIITHNKRTMETAPTLYGVTMPQAGVSRLVSVQVDQPLSQRAAS